MYNVRQMSSVEREYRRRSAELDVVDRIRRAEAMFLWSRDYLARSLHSSPEVASPLDLKFEIALRQYGSDPVFRRLIDELRDRASC